MGDLLLRLLDLGGRLMPFRVVPQWSVGLYMVAGKCRGSVGPGLKLVVPGLCDVILVTVVPKVYTTPLQSVSLQDGTMLSFSASVTVIVTDARRACLEIDRYQETVEEIAAAVLAQGMADASPAQMSATRESRKQFLAELQREINDVIEPYGMTIAALRINNYTPGVRTLRLLLDRAVLHQDGARP